MIFIGDIFVRKKYFFFGVNFFLKILRFFSTTEKFLKIEKNSNQILTFTLVKKIHLAVEISHTIYLQYTGRM